MRLDEALKRAVAEHNAIMAGRCADVLRYRYGMTYAQVFAFVCEHVPGMTGSRWESLMYEADMESEGGLAR